MVSSTTRENTNELRRDAKNTLQSTKRDIKDTIDDISGDITYIANRAGREVRGYIDAANDELTHVTDRVTEEIRVNPLRSALIALGAGFVLGVLFRR